MSKLLLNCCYLHVLVMILIHFWMFSTGIHTHGPLQVNRHLSIKALCQSPIILIWVLTHKNKLKVFYFYS